MVCSYFQAVGQRIWGIWNQLQRHWALQIFNCKPHNFIFWKIWRIKNGGQLVYSNWESVGENSDIKDHDTNKIWPNLLKGYFGLFWRGSGTWGYQKFWSINIQIPLLFKINSTGARIFESAVKEIERSRGKWRRCECKIWAHEKKVRKRKRTTRRSLSNFCRLAF